MDMNHIVLLVEVLMDETEEEMEHEAIFVDEDVDVQDTPIVVVVLDLLV